MCAYRSEDDESREEVEDGVERGRQNGSELVAGRDGHRHHAIVGEEQERAEQEEDVVAELHRRPLEAHHGVRDDGVEQRLHQTIRNLNQNLGYCVRDRGVHPRRSLPVEDRPLDRHHWLRSRGVVHAQKQHGRVHGSQNAEQTRRIGSACNINDESDL
jgi:hypothetical protein